MGQQYREEQVTGRKSWGDTLGVFEKTSKRRRQLRPNWKGDGHMQVWGGTTFQAEESTVS
jgi:hypothetical protein